MYMPVSSFNFIYLLTFSLSIFSFTHVWNHGTLRGVRADVTEDVSMLTCNYLPLEGKVLLAVIVCSLRVPVG